MPRLKLAESLWAATAQPGPQIEPRCERIKVDVAIIGAGFNGLRAALVLAELAPGKDKQDLPIPVSEFKKYPFYRFLRVGIKIAVSWKEYQDRREAVANKYK